MSHITYDVQKVDGSWEVRKEGSSRRSKRADTESEAIEKARKLAEKNTPSEVRVRTSRTGSQHKAGQWRTVHAYHDTHRTVYNVQEAHSSDGWEVRKSGAKRASKTAETEKQAMKMARKLAKKNKPSEVRIRSSRDGRKHKHGQWRAEHVYG